MLAYNPYIVIPLATWAIAQVAKFALAAMRGRIDFRYLYASGGMPSVHSAVVCSLATTALLVDGPNSHLFGLTAILAAIVMYDSFGVRRSSGEQAMAINMLIGSLERGKVKLDNPHVHLREILGHQPIEVSVGAVVGVVLGGLFNYDKLTPLFTFLQQVPQGIEMWSYVAVFGLIILVGIVQRLVTRKKFRSSPTMRTLTQRILVACEVVGWLGLVECLFQYERANYLAWRGWTVAIMSVGLIWALVLALQSYRTVPSALLEEAEEARKRRWFEWGRKRKAKKK